MIWLLVFALGLGISVLSLPQTANAQTDKDKKERKQEIEDNDDDEKLSDEDKRAVKLSIDDARKIALERVPGSVIDEELEKENGRLQYSFDIRNAEGKVFDVEISAVTGEVLQAEEDCDDDDDDSAKAKSMRSKKTSAKNAKVTKPKTP